MAVVMCLCIALMVMPAVASMPGSSEPGFRCQWALLNQGHTFESCRDSGPRGVDIRIQEAWAVVASVGQQRPGVIAVTERGFDITHPDLANQLWVNPGEDGLDAAGVPKRDNGIDDDHNGYIDDVHGWNFNNNTHTFPQWEHGTQVASVAAGDADNGVGIAGVAGLDGQARIMLLVRPSGPDQQARYIEMLDYARLMGADVINASHAAPAQVNSNEALSAASGWLEAEVINAARRATEAGVVLALASTLGSDFTPAEIDGWDAYDFPGVLRVQASNLEGKRARGLDKSDHRVEIAAPGVGIYVPNDQGGYEFVGNADSGSTSLATPHVSAVVALIKGLYPHLHGHAVAQAIIDSADYDPSFELANKAKGRLNAYKALVRAGQL